MTLEDEEIPTQKPRRKWKDMAGLLPHPALGQDAQTYISQLRRAVDETRTGCGDYSKDRHQWLDSQNMDSVLDRIQKWRKRETR